MRIGDWVTIEGRKYSLGQRRLESYSSVRRIARVTPTGWIVADGYSNPFKPNGAEYRDKEGQSLRPSTLEEIAQAEALEREAAEKAQQRKDAANVMRVTLSSLRWAVIDDDTIEQIYKLISDPHNRVEPMQLKLGKGKR